MTETQITIEEAQAGQRVDAFVAAHLNVSRSRAQKLLEGATLNQTRVKPSHVLKLGDVLLLPEIETTIEEAAAQIASENMPMPELINKLVFVYEDEHLMVINKPRGLLVHLGAGERVATLVDFLRQQNKPLSSVGPPERAGIVHRLDKDTSGLIIVCKTDAAHWKLAEDFSNRRLTKNYIALVCGVPPLRGRIEAPIERHATHRKKFAVVPHGKDAITEYNVTQHWRKFALLDVNLLTGRTHQIRVHLNCLNHPIAGDPLYGGEKRALDSAGNDEVRAALQQLDGQALHAAKLAFTHPMSDVPLQFEAPMPDDMQNVIAALNAAE
jgi:23S rRNA pseudouridine1911/1915/1917 synthase